MNVCLYTAYNSWLCFMRQQSRPLMSFALLQSIGYLPKDRSVDPANYMQKSFQSLTAHKRELISASPQIIRYCQALRFQNEQNPFLFSFCQISSKRLLIKTRFHLHCYLFTLSLNMCVCWLIVTCGCIFLAVILACLAWPYSYPSTGI